MLKELSYCIGRWRDGIGAGLAVRFDPETGQISDDGTFTIVDFDDFLAYCGDFSFESVTAGVTNTAAAEKYLNLYWADIYTKLETL